MWTTPRDWTTGELVTESIMDTHVRDNLNNVHITNVTALPGTPDDGQLIVYTDSLTSPTYQWQFRYHAGSSEVAKWEFIGGMMRLSAEGNLSFANQLSYVVSAVTITAPLFGEYEVHVMAKTQRNTGNIGYWSYAKNGTPQGDAKASLTDSAYAGALDMIDIAVLNAGDVLAIAYKASNTGTNHYLDGCRIGVLPRKVG